MSSKIKRREKQKQKKRKEKKKKIETFCLETRARSEGYVAKVFKAQCPKPTGWESPILCSPHGWMGEVYQIVGVGVSKSFEVRGET